MNVLILDKKSTKTLAKGLTHREFLCKCKHKDCTYTLVNEKLVGAFEKFRLAWNASIWVTSGFRCQKHNSDVGGERDSFHKKGSAIDLTLGANDPRSIEEFADLAKEFFDVVILYKDKNFIHCHMED